MDDLQLLALAREAAQHAHCPYSHFQVGAALLSADGQVFQGCNVENASYGLTICAERTAICSAIAAGVDAFASIAILATSVATPCGACRQFLAEFVQPAFRILVAPIEDVDQHQIYTMEELLPHHFVFQDSAVNRK